MLSLFETDLVITEVNDNEIRRSGSTVFVLEEELVVPDKILAVRIEFGIYCIPAETVCKTDPFIRVDLVITLGFFINGGDATINPHFDICSKEITTVGSWVYTLRDYATTFDFLKRAIAIGLPIKELITHKYPLEQINEALETNLKMEGLKIAIINK